MELDLISPRIWGRFEEDGLEIIKGDWQISCFGYIINMHELCHDCKTDIGEIIIGIIEANPGILQSTLKGSYLLIVKNSKTKDIYIFNDLLSKYSVFYTIVEDVCVVSDSFLTLVENLKTKGFQLTPDSLAVKMMNRFECLFDDVTYVKEIKFLKPYNYLKLNSDFHEVISIETPTTNNSVSVSETANTLNVLFENACKLITEKNSLNKKKQIITISGGMDSRTTLMYGVKCGCKYDTSYCYSQSGSKDIEIAQSISSDLGIPLLFYTMDKGWCIRERESLITKNDGMMCYSGTTGLNICLNNLNTIGWGLVHTGLGGGEIMGDITFNPSSNEIAWSHFEKYLECNEKESERINIIKSKYRNFNEFSNLNDVRRCLNSQKIALEFCDYASPFLDETLFSFMLSVPYAIKKNRELYFYWIDKFLPNHFNYENTFRFGCKPNQNFKYMIYRVYHGIMNRIGLKTKHDMNPFMEWCLSNKLLLEEQEVSFHNDLMNLEGKIEDDILFKLKEEYKKSSFRKRTHIITSSYILSKII